MNARLRLLLVVAMTLAGVVLPGWARAVVPCDGWVSGDTALQLRGPNGHLVLRASPEGLAALRRTLLAHCGDAPAARPPLDIGPVELEGELVTAPQGQPGGVLELKVRLRADRLRLTVQ